MCFSGRRQALAILGFIRHEFRVRPESIAGEKRVQLGLRLRTRGTCQRAIGGIVGSLGWSSSA